MNQMPTATITVRVQSGKPPSPLSRLLLITSIEELLANGDNYLHTSSR